MFSALRRRQSAKGATRADTDLGLGKALHYLRRYEESLPPLEEAIKLSPGGEVAQSARCAPGMHA